MRLDDLMDEVFDVLADVPGLNDPGVGRLAFTPPAPFAELPTITFGDLGPGLDRIPDFAVTVYFGKPDSPQVFRDALEYASTAGPRSIPRALALHDWTSCHTLRCGSAEPTIDPIAGVPMLGYTFHLDITGAP